MSIKEIHEINFVDEKHYDVYLLTLHLHLDVGNSELFSIEEQEYKDRYKVSLGTKSFYVPKDLIDTFWKLLENASYLDVEELMKQEKITWIHNVIIDSVVSTSMEDLVGEDFVSVERRASGLATAAGGVIREISKLINEQMEIVNKDTSIVKDFDGILTFNTELGKDFNIRLCFDKVPPIYPEIDKFVIQRTDILPEDLETYFGEVGKKINSRLAHINSLVGDFFASKKLSDSKDLTEYGESLINHTLIMAFLSQHITFISFGGKDDWRSNSTETPNNKACFVYLDQEVDKIFKLLDGIPKEEGVEVYSIDIDTFAIFGRKDNKVVTPALQGYTENILNHYSQGFERVLTNRLTHIDSDYIFKA